MTVSGRAPARDAYRRGLEYALVERLQGMEHMGEASSSEVGVALDVLQELLGGTPAEPSVFVTEYLHLEGGEARLGRRPLRDGPSWADDLSPVHTHGVPSHE